MLKIQTEVEDLKKLNQANFFALQSTVAKDNNDSLLALNDDKLLDLFNQIQSKLTTEDTVEFAKQLMKSPKWTIPRLGPKVISKIEEILF